MTKIEEYLHGLPIETKDLFRPTFESIDKFYAAVYTLYRNEHVIDLQKPDKYEERMKAIADIKKRIETLLDSFGLDGKEVMADIASDYFEDFVKYKENERLMNPEEFIKIIKKVTA
jgi:hypothetical protein